MRIILRWIRDLDLVDWLVVFFVSLLVIVVPVVAISTLETHEERVQLYNDWCQSQGSTNITIEQWCRLRREKLLPNTQGQKE